MSDQKTSTKPESSKVHSSHATDVGQFFSDLEGGVFEQVLGVALSDVAAGAMDNDATGKVNIKLSISQFGSSQQMIINHEIEHTRPSMRGSVREVVKGKTAMFINPGGKLSLFSLSQGDMFEKQK